MQEKKYKIYLNCKRFVNTVNKLRKERHLYEQNYQNLPKNIRRFKVAARQCRVSDFSRSTLCNRDQYNYELEGGHV